MRDAPENASEGDQLAHLWLARGYLMMHVPQQVNRESHERAAIVDWHWPSASHADVGIGERRDQGFDGVPLRQRIGAFEYHDAALRMPQKQVHGRCLALPPRLRQKTHSVVAPAVLTHDGVCRVGRTAG